MTGPPPPLARLAATAASQYGRFTTAQYLAAGRSQDQLDRDVRAGRYEREWRGVLKVAGAPSSWEGTLMGATLAHPGRVLAARASVLRLSGLRAPDSRPQVVVPHELGYDFDDRVRVHVSRTFDRCEPIEVARIPCTPISRSLVEEGMRDPGPRWFDLVCEAVRRGLTNQAELGEALELAGRVPNRRRMHDALDRLDPRLARARSVPEISLVTVIEEATGLRPVLNHRILDQAGGVVDEVDAALPEVLLAFEGDSRTWHVDPWRMDDDLLKNDRLEDRHWLVKRLPIRLLHRRPEQFHRIVARTYDRALARMPSVPAWAIEDARRR